MLLSDHIEESKERIENKIQFLRKLVEEVKKLEDNQELNKALQERTLKDW
jgi:hypothetical protein